MTKELASKWKNHTWGPDDSTEGEDRKHVYDYTLSNGEQTTIFHNASGQLVSREKFLKHYKEKSKALARDEIAFYHAYASKTKPVEAANDNSEAGTPLTDMNFDDAPAVDVQQGTAKLSSNKSTISLPLVMGAYDTNLKDGRRVKRIHVIVQTPSSWDPAFAKSLNYFELAGGGKELVIDFSSENPIFCADELLVNDIFLDENGQHIYKNLTAEGEKHEALLKFEEEIEKDKDVPSKMVIALPFECSELCTIALGNEAKGILKIPKVSKSKNVFVLLFAPSIFHSNSHVFLSLSLVS